MTPDKIVRTALRISVPFNFLAAYAVAIPGSFIGRLIGFTPDGNVLNASILAFMIGTFGLVYAWLSMQKKIDRPLVFFSAVAKSGVFVVAFLVWVQGNASGMTVLFTVGDLLFAGIFFWWLMKTSSKGS